MRPRQDITEMFSSFIELESDKFSKWLTNIRLQNNMRRFLDSAQQMPRQEKFWALYWHKNWQSESNHLAKMHLLAYLQEPCYHVSLKTGSLLRSSKYSIADYFQMANAEVEALLSDFNPQKSSNLKAYFTMAIKSRLRDILRQRRDIDFCSSWALLRKISKKLFVEALNNAGLSTLQTAQYRLAWTCFKELYVQHQAGGTKALPKPTPQLWQAIANLYNNSRHQLNQSSSECTAQKIEEWLNKSVKYVRAYLFPSVQSLDILRSDSDSSQTVDLPDPSSDSVMADMIAREDLGERQHRMSDMVGVLSNSLRALDITSQRILQLYYQDELTQQQIMEELGISQSTVSRKLVRGRESLLKGLIKWSVELNISIKPNEINNMSIALEELLRNRFGDFSPNT
ncbi:MAG: sigma-70 family RNA polymerase sigma factor [Cyanobacteria bacterium J06649_11]